MLNRSVYTISMILALGALSGCGATAPDTSKVNTFVRPCAASGLGPYGAYMTKTYSIPSDGSSTSLTVKFFSDEACETLVNTAAYTMSPEKVGLATGVTRGESTDVAGVLKTNVTFKTATFTPATEAAAGLLTATTFCGLTDWEAETAQSIAGETCLGGAFSAPAAGFVLHTLFGAEDSSIYLGQASGSNNGTTSALRYTELDSTAYVKQ